MAETANTPRPSSSKNSAEKNERSSEPPTKQPRKSKVETKWTKERLLRIVAQNQHHQQPSMSRTPKGLNTAKTATADQKQISSLKPRKLLYWSR